MISEPAPMTMAMARIDGEEDSRRETTLIMVMANVCDCDVDDKTEANGEDHTQ